MGFVVFVEESESESAGLRGSDFGEGGLGRSWGGVLGLGRVEGRVTGCEGEGRFRGRGRFLDKKSFIVVVRRFRVGFSVILSGDNSFCFLV